MECSELLKNTEQKMSKSLEQFSHDLKGLRTGRASAGFVEPVVVHAYGSKMGINEVATISVPDPTTISIQVWDKEIVKPVEKAIVEANLGVSPSVDGTVIRLNMPALTEDRRKELVKIAHKYCENARIAVRNIRRDSLDNLKKIEKNKEISEDQLHVDMKKIQEITDKYIKYIDDNLRNKETEIMQI